MKKFFSIVIAVAMLLTFASCGSSAKTENVQSKAESSSETASSSEEVKKEPASSTTEEKSSEVAKPETASSSEEQGKIVLPSGKPTKEVTTKGSKFNIVTKTYSNGQEYYVLQFKDGDKDEVYTDKDATAKRIDELQGTTVTTTVSEISSSSEVSSKTDESNEIPVVTPDPDRGYKDESSGITLPDEDPISQKLIKTKDGVGKLIEKDYKNGDIYYVFRYNDGKIGGAYSDYNAALYMYGTFQ